MGLQCRLYRDGTLTEEAFDPERISDLLKENGTLVWLDIEDPDEGKLRMLQGEFSLHPLAVEDALHRNQRAKVEAYEHHFFVVIHAMRLDGEDLRDSEVHVFVGPGFLVTLRYAPAFDMTAVRHRWEKQGDLAKEGGGALLYALLDEVVDDYFDVVERLEDTSEDIEGKVFADEPVEDIQEQIFLLKKRVLQFRRAVLPLREVLDLLEEEVGVVTDRLRPYFRDVADHVLRVLEFVDNVRELLTAALEAHLSQVSNRLNEVMKKLTSWAAIILVPTLIAGIYGMNFRFMPELDWRLGYPLALGLMAVSGLILYRMFKRRRWL